MSRISDTLRDGTSRLARGRDESLAYNDLSPVLHPAVHGGSLSEDEVFVLIASIILAVVGISGNSTYAFPSLFFRRNPALGIVRLSVLVSMLWIAFVLRRYADPS